MLAAVKLNYEIETHIEDQTHQTLNSQFQTSRMSNEFLMTNMRRLVREERRITHEILLHICEVEKR